MKLDLDNIETVEIDLTTMCNARCPLCYRNHQTYPEKYKIPFARSSTDILNQLLKFKNLKRVELIGQLSEPTTHPEFILIVKELKKLGKQLKICTNGDLNGEDFWHDLGSLLDNNDRVWFTLCGSTQEIHSKYRVGTSLSNILANASSLRKVREVDGARALVFKYNYEDIKSQKFKEILDRFTFTETITSSIVDHETEFISNFDLSQLSPVDQVQKDYKNLEKFSQICKMQIDCQSIDEHQVQIDPFGDIYPCYVFLENCSGTAWNQDYSSILAGENSFCRFCKRQVAKMKNDLKLNSII